MAIDEAEAVKRMVLACPGFHDSLVSYRDSGGNPEEGFNMMSELARWVVGQVSAGDFTCFQELFSELESLLANDLTNDARDVLVIGFIEDIHNDAVRLRKPDKRIDPDLVFPYLGPKSRATWFELVNHYSKWGESWPGRVRDA